jgi:hypothetical protein
VLSCVERPGSRFHTPNGTVPIIGVSVNTVQLDHDGLFG